MNMKPETTESIYRLTIKPVVMIGNPILEAFSEEAQRRRFPNSTLQNFSTYSTRITPKSKYNERNSSLQHESNNVKFGGSHEPDMKNCNNDIHHLTINHALLHLAELQTSNLKSLKLSNSLIRLLLRLKHYILLKDVRLQFINNQDDGTRKMKNESNLDYKSKKFNIFNSNVNINSSSNSKKDGYTTEKNIFNMKNINWNIKVKINTILKNEGRYRNNINATETRLKKEQKKVKQLEMPINISNEDYSIVTNAKSHRFEDAILETITSDAVTPQINDWIYEFITEITHVFSLNNLTAAEISNKTIYMTTETTANDTDINRNLSVIDVNRNNKSLRKTSRRKQASAFQKYYDKYLKKLIYESKSPKVEIRRYFPNINQTFINVNDIDKMSIDSSNRSSVQQNRDRGKKKCNTSKMRKQSNSTFERFYGSNESSTENNDIIDSGLINPNETSELITIDDCAYSKESQKSREILKIGSKNNVAFLLNWTKISSTRAPDIVTQNENESRKEETEKHKRKNCHNDHKNNRSKKGKKNHNAKRKRKPTSTAWMVDETTSVDYGNDYSSERRRMSSRNDPGYDKADGNRNTSTSKSDWHLTDEITTEPLKMESSNVDESVTEHLTKDNTKERLQSEGRTNADLITDDTTFRSSIAYKGKKFKKCKTRVTAITENNCLYDKKINNEEDEELINCEDVTSLPVTSDSEDKIETSSYSDDYYPFAHEKISTSASTTSKNLKKNKLNNVEKSTIYDTITNRKSKNRNSTTEKTILNKQSDDNNERRREWSRSGENTIHSITGSIMRDAISYLDSEEEEDSTEKSMFIEDNEINNGVVTSVEDYEADSCNENQYACDKYTCIENDQVCDGIVDCINTSDEINCDRIYTKRWEEHLRVKGQPEKFDLPSQNSIENTLLDGCSLYEHPCDGTCINALNICDGKRDCLDGTDEEGCSSLEGIL